MSTPSDDLVPLAERYAPLIFGIFGHTEDDEGQIVARVGGSGVFVAPCYGLTAAHVVRDLFNTIPGRADDLRRRTEGYSVLPHWSGLFQIGNYRNKEVPAVVWGVTRIWQTPLADICLLEAAPDGEPAVDRLNDQRRAYRQAEG